MPCREQGLTERNYTVMYIHMNATNLIPILSDPVRLALVGALKSGERSVGDLTEAVGIAQSGVSRHLRILHRGGVVSVRADAQRRLYALRPEPFLQLEGWLQEFHALWSARLDRFAGALAARQLEGSDDQ
jgi:DNA-binding transcriptional ArsR family regulator